MKNIWIEKRKKSLEEFKFLNHGRWGYVFDVDHPTVMSSDPDVPMTTRIVIYNDNVQVIWGMTKEHSKYVKETAELFRSELISKAIKAIKEYDWDSYYKKIWSLSEKNYLKS